MTMMPRRCAARNSSTVSSGVACQNRAIDSGRMLRKATNGACSRKLGEPGREAVARRIARKIGDQRLEAPARSRLR